jgi:hypothetical protein
MIERRKKDRRSGVERRSAVIDRRAKEELGYGIEKRGEVKDRRVRMRRFHHRREGWISI